MVWNLMVGFGWTQICCSGDGTDQPTAFVAALEDTGNVREHLMVLHWGSMVATLSLIENETYMIK